MKKRAKSFGKPRRGQQRPIRPKELRKVCRGGPEILFIGGGADGKVDLSDEAQQYLSRRAIRLEVLPTTQAVEAYNRSKQRKAALMQATC